jgi:hypothetical protein
MTPEMHKIKSNTSPLLTTFIVSLFASLILVFLATNGSFDLFQPSFLWKAYNYYFLSLIDGRLDVPVESIGREGTFYDGKTFMYYGLLPTLPRLILHPFVDLTKVSAGYFSILFFTLLGNVTLQYSVVRHFFANLNTDFNNKGRKSWIQILSLIIISLIIWFGSANFLISQNATLYHEPYAAALCIINIYMALLIRDGFFLSGYRNISLLPYALLAGLCIHSRMPTALSLYLVTGLIILVQVYKQLKQNSSHINLFTILMGAVSRFWKEILVLLLFGLSILWLNYAKYGDVFSFMGKNYGFVFLEGFSERQCNVIPTNEFYKFTRIIVNAYTYLSGDWQSHWSLTRLLHTGYGRVEMPAVSAALLWGAPITCFMIVTFKSLFNIKQLFSCILILFILAFSAGALFQLSYPTITHRYLAELWLPLGASLLFCWYRHVVNPTIFCVSRWKSILVSFIALFGLIGVSYQLFIASTNKYYLEDGPVTNPAFFHYSDEDHALLGSLTTEKIKSFYVERNLHKTEQCKKYKELNFN